MRAVVTDATRRLRAAARARSADRTDARRCCRRSSRPSFDAYLQRNYWLSVDDFFDLLQDAPDQAKAELDANKRLKG